MITCPICPYHCALNERQTGRCRARRCMHGKIEAINYGQVTSLALDPIEKKPLMRFHPGSFILSVGSFGCNMNCPFCQNASISMADEEISSDKMEPEELLAAARAMALRPEGNLGIAFTYNEPVIGYEFVYDTAKLFREAGMKTVMVTNGQICRGPLEKLLPYIDAMNIDLKAFRPEFYDWAGGSLATARQTIALAAKQCHVEVTTLIIPGMNDSAHDMEAEAAWLAGLSPDMPLHISRFFPHYHLMDVPPTPVETIDALCEIARKHLNYVYKGNC